MYKKNFSKQLVFTFQISYFGVTKHLLDFLLGQNLQKIERQNYRKTERQIDI